MNDAAVVAEPEASSRLVGSSVPRVEDHRLLTGAGAYLGDIQLPNMKHVAVLRSTVAHARIVSVDLSAAMESPGVVAAFTGPELAEHSRALSHMLPIPTIQDIEWNVLATDKVRFVGEPVAVVVADDRYLAEDAIELIDVEYDDLPVVVDALTALEEDAPLLYEAWATNDFLSSEFSTGDLDLAFEQADGVLADRIKHHRVIGLPLEGHGSIAYLDRGTGQLQVHVSSQQPHNLRTVISDVTGISEANIRVIAPDMGGGFGNKQHFLREDLLTSVLAMRVPFPVAWVQDRFESLTSSVHSREQIHDVEVAYRSDGRVTGMRVRVLADIGNPVLYFTGAAPALVTASLLTGAYDIPNFASELHCVATNKCPAGAYRGFGQPQAILTIERVMDLVAERVGIDPVVVRQRNLIPDSPRPFRSPTGALYDTGSHREQLETLVHAIDYHQLRQQQIEARSVGRAIGIGLACMIESTAPNLHAVAGRFGGFEMALVSIQPDGHVNIAVGTKSQGQGHRTVFAQVAADELTIPLQHIEVVDGDTSTLPYGMGTWGSRSAVMGGGAVLKGVRQLKAKMTAIAAHMLETSESEVRLLGGFFRAGERAIPLQAVAQAAYLHTFLMPPGMDMGLSTVVSYDPGNTDAFPDSDGKMNVASTYASAAAAAVVEVDVNTGTVDVLGFTIVHDCGNVINPLIVDGQIQGAFAQALGTVFLEELVYDESGQLLTSSLVDYLIPGAGDVPKATAVHLETPSPLLGGFRGAGEAAIVAGPAALVNAVHDALAPFGVTVNQTNLNQYRLRRLLRAAGVEADPLGEPAVLGRAGRGPSRSTYSTS